MQESYECEVATHIGPESCGAAREGGVEALTGERAGRVFSRVRQLLRDADAVRRCGRPHLVHRYREVHWSPARSETPCTYGSTSRGNREIPGPPRAAVALGRIGKSKDERR
jgi:RNA-directed DNA polymerase